MRARARCQQCHLEHTASCVTQERQQHAIAYCQPNNHQKVKVKIKPKLSSPKVVSCPKTFSLGDAPHLRPPVTRAHRQPVARASATERSRAAAVASNAAAEQQRRGRLRHARALLLLLLPLRRDRGGARRGRRRRVRLRGAIRRLLPRALPRHRAAGGRARRQRQARHGLLQAKQNTPCLDEAALLGARSATRRTAALRRLQSNNPAETQRQGAARCPPAAHRIRLPNYKFASSPLKNVNLLFRRSFCSRVSPTPFSLARCCAVRSRRLPHRSNLARRLVRVPPLLLPLTRATRHARALRHGRTSEREPRPGCRKCTIPREPPAPRRRASFKPQRALGHSWPPAAASFKP